MLPLVLGLWLDGRKDLATVTESGLVIQVPCWGQAKEIRPLPLDLGRLLFGRLYSVRSLQVFLAEPARRHDGRRRLLPSCRGQPVRSNIYSEGRLSSRLLAARLTSGF